jgi:hypothetical protein
MTDALDAIPEDAIYLLDAFERVFQKQTPRWQVFGRRCDAIKLALLLHQENPLYTEKCQKVLDKALVPFDCAQFRANEWLRLRISDGALTAYIRNPVTDKLLQLPRTGWDCRALTKSAIVSNFVGPDDMDAPGPDTVVAGARRPVFFKAAEFQQLLEVDVGASLAEAFQPINYHTGAPGRPSPQFLVKAEMERRAKDAAYVWGGIGAEAELLAAWLAKTHPNVPSLTPKAIENLHRDRLRKLKNTRK